MLSSTLSYVGSEIPEGPKESSSTLWTVASGRQFLVIRHIWVEPPACIRLLISRRSNQAKSSKNQDHYRDYSPDGTFVPRTVARMISA